jgi:hypothetical protein
MAVAEPDPEHLKLVQGVITRMAGNSFLLKGWAVTLVAGLTAFAKADADRDLAWIGCGVVVLFGLLDAMYLANERAYRTLYDNVVRKQTKLWSLERPDIPIGDFVSAVCSWSVLPLYAAAAVGSALVASGI